MNMLIICRMNRVQPGKIACPERRPTCTSDDAGQTDWAATAGLCGPRGTHEPARARS